MTLREPCGYCRGRGTVLAEIETTPGGAIERRKTCPECKGMGDKPALCVEVSLAQFRALRRIMGELAEDLEAEIWDRYPGETALEARRRKRDLEPVREARDLLGALPKPVEEGKT